MKYKGLFKTILEKCLHLCLAKILSLLKNKNILKFYEQSCHKDARS